MEKKEYTPPKLFLRFFRWYCHPKLVKHIEGDLMELYDERVREEGKRKADIRFIVDVALLFRPGIIRPAKEYGNVNHYTMYKSYFKIGWRNLSNNKGYSIINIGGLALGMAVAIMIGLWVWDELSFNKYHENYDRIAAVMQNTTYGDNVETWSSESYQLGDELRNSYGSTFKYVVMSSFTQNPILSHKEKALTKTGYFMEADGPEMLTLKMKAGDRNSLQDTRSIMLSESTAYALFGEEEMIGQTVLIDNQFDVKVAGIYEDIPDNSSFSDMLFIAPLDLLARNGNRNLSWVNNWLEVYVLLAENVDMASASNAIKDAKLKNVSQDLAKFKPELFLHPLSKWRLYSGFENGVNTGGRIETVWMFSIIGVFVLLLACINFMNLSTARSEKRAKEVGVRKVVGSLRSQLVRQFFSESFLMVTLAFVFSMILVQLTLPWFNEVADKRIGVIWTNQWLWLFGLSIVSITAFISGSYPAFYLSSFNPGKVLKGTFRVGRGASIPRKVLVVAQFTVSVILTVGTTIVYQQIQFARNRPLGYNQNGLITIPMKTKEVKDNYQKLRNDLLETGLISNVSRSECMATDMYWSDYGFDWKGKDPGMQDIVYRGAVDFGFGETVGWRIKEGRDFSIDLASDSTAIILNEAAVAYMGLKDPIGETVKLYDGVDYTIIGVVEDMVSQYIYFPVEQTYYIIDRFNRFQYINVRIDQQAGVAWCLKEIEQAFKKNNPDTPFEYRFADEQVADKYTNEVRVGKLAGTFAVLAMIISCLGLFGLAAFVAEQRTKEIGVRKVVGASIFSLWKLLSKDFVILVIIACLIALPLSYYLMSGWLQQYPYKTPMSWSVFALTILSALLITLATVSYQAIKAAMMSPVKSLRSE
jgi:ABC-type antimicrobial peptide transport system permease subunit